MNRRHLAGVVLVIGLGLAACGDDGPTETGSEGANGSTTMGERTGSEGGESTDTTDGSSASTTTTVQDTTTTTSADDGGEATPGELRGEVRYVRSGGIAGEIYEVVVTPDGRLGGGRNLSEDQLASLVEAVEDAEAAGLPSDWSSADPCCDLFTYVVTYDGEELVQTDDANLHAVPDELKKVLDTLSALGG